MVSDGFEGFFLWFLMVLRFRRVSGGSIGTMGESSKKRNGSCGFLLRKI